MTRGSVVIGVALAGLVAGGSAGLALVSEDASPQAGFAALYADGTKFFCDDPDDRIMEENAMIDIETLAPSADQAFRDYMDQRVADAEYAAELFGDDRIVAFLAPSYDVDSFVSQRFEPSGDESTREAEERTTAAYFSRDAATADRLAERIVVTKFGDDGYAVTDVTACSRSLVSDYDAMAEVVAKHYERNSLGEEE